jgi:hypothetical protein
MTGELPTGELPAPGHGGLISPESADLFGDTRSLAVSQRALGVPPDVPSAGLEHTVGLLAKMTPPVDFIELATGRSEVKLFPVLR